MWKDRLFWPKFGGKRAKKLKICLLFKIPYTKEYPSRLIPAQVTPPFVYTVRISHSMTNLFSFLPCMSAITKHFFYKIFFKIFDKGNFSLSAAKIRFVSSIYIKFGQIFEQTPINERFCKFLFSLVKREIWKITWFFEKLLMET